MERLTTNKSALDLFAFCRDVGVLSHIPAQKDDNSPYEAPRTATAQTIAKQLPSAAARLSLLVMPLPLKTTPFAFPVARVKPDHEQLYLYQFPDQAFLPLTFRPLGRGQGDAIEKLKKCTLLFVSFSWEGFGMVRKVSPLTHVTATHNPTTKKIIWGANVPGKQEQCAQ